MSGTYISKIPVLVVALVIGIVLVTSAVVPLASDYSEAKTFKNEGYYTMDQLTDSSEVTIKWAKATPGIVTVNGVDFDMSAFVQANLSYTLIGSESMIVRYSSNGANNGGLQAFYNGSGYTSFHSNSDASAGTEATITVSGGSATFTSNGTSGLNSNLGSIGDDAYVINPSGTGEYAVMKKSDVPAYVLGDSDIRLIGVSVTAGPNGIALYGSGSIDDGLTISTIYKSNSITTVTYSDPEVTDTEISGYTEALYSLEKYTFTITYDTNTYDATYSYFIVPVDVTVEPDNPAAYKNLVKVVPLMAFIMLVVAAAGMVYFKNKD